MREILFRGKRIDNGEWVEGDLRHWPSNDVGIHCDLLRRTLTVDPNTVGQYTGLKDENGKKIFEGDVIKWVPGIRTITGIVEFDEGGYCANKYFLHAGLRNGQFDGIVIGNIYDKEATNENE